jgi:glycosyltransferase involved in cell wall biosynthesis
MLVSIISPCRNEAGHIDAYVQAVLAQECRGFDLEVVIADGQSDDGTRQKLEAWMQCEPRLKFIANPGRIVSTGLNLALQESRGEIVVRLDIHTTYAPDYVAECVKALQETGATCVGGPWVARGEGLVQRAVACAFQSRFGSGGAASRNASYSGPVDTVYLGAWRRADLLAIGGFDENLVRNQDDELNLRIIRGGGRVWQSSAIRSEYRPRASLAALFRQFHQYGYWKVPVIRKHHLPASPRHLAPFGFVVWLAVLALAAPFSIIAATALLATLLVYAIVALACAAAVQGVGASASGMAVTALAFACMHAGYGLGFGRGLWEFAVLRRGATEKMTRLTR